MAQPYTKLTGRNRDFLGYKQLWFADDHLLLVHNSRFAETYKRFSLRDVQGLVVTDLPVAWGLRAVFVTFVALFALAAFAADSVGLRVTWALFGAIPLFFLIRDFVRGPRCVCRICTEVSVENLPVSRTSDLQDLLRKLLPLIEQTQGVLDPSIAPRLPAGPRPVAPSGAAPEVPKRLSLVELILAVLLMVSMALVWFGYSLKHPEVYLMTPVFFIGETVLGAILYFGIRGSVNQAFLRILSPLVSILSALDLVAGFALFIAYTVNVAEAVRQPGAAKVNWYDAEYLKLWIYYATAWRAVGTVFLIGHLLANRAAKPDATGGEASPL